MPNITFILPHWIYWGGILAVPVFFVWASRRTPAKETADISLPLVYFFLMISGFMGIHRLYLKHWGAVVYIVLFIAIILSNQGERLARNELSIAKNEIFNISYDLKRAQDDEEDAAVIARLQQSLDEAKPREVAIAERMDQRRQTSGTLAILILCLLLIDALLMPSTVRRIRERRRAQQATQAPPVVMPEDRSVTDIPGGRFVDAVSKTNRLIGEAIAYWTIIAVFVFYYEVIARYIFNSPTVWAHESMFLMFGMQYLLAGGFCLRENAHVRVDVIYMHLSTKTKRSRI